MINSKLHLSDENRVLSELTFFVNSFGLDWHEYYMKYD